MESAADTPGQMLVEAAAQFVAPELEAAVRARVADALRRAGKPRADELIRSLTTTGDEWGYQTPNALARELNSVLGMETVDESSRLEGTKYLNAARPTVYVANHLSFSDANLFAYLLEQEGHGDVVDRLCVLAGPKVFTDPFRRFFSLVFGAIKLPQSASRASGEAVMPLREVARLAALSIETAHERLRRGDQLMIFIEGSRSRDSQMQEALGAVSRYLEPEGTLVQPVGIWGSEGLVPIDDERAHRTRVFTRIGPPILARRLFDAASGKRQLVMDALGRAIAELLPPEYRGYYGTEKPASIDVLSLARQS